MDMERQAYGIERTVDTRAGVAYSLSLDYAGRLGLDLNHTRIGIYVDGVQVGTHAGVSSNAALNWESLNFSFTGSGGKQSIRIVVEASPELVEAGVTNTGHDDHHEGHGNGAMVDNIVLTETLPVNTGYQDSAINLSDVVATLTDTDGSEVLGVTIGAIPTGAILTDGAHAFVATNSLHLVSVTDWNLANLSIVAPSGFVGTFALTIAASATETSPHPHPHPNPLPQAGEGTNGAQGAVQPLYETANLAMSLPVTVVASAVTMKPEMQNGNWLLERGMVKFSDGHTATMADAYFEVAPNPVQSKVEGAPKTTTNSASITLRSELATPIQTAEGAAHVLGISSGADSVEESFGSAVAEQFISENKRHAPAIQWGEKAAITNVQADADDAKKKQKAKPAANWLSEFLGVEKGSDKKDAASLSNLSVSLKKDSSKLDS